VDTQSYKTVSANKATVKKEWLLVDAENETVGRLASKVAYLVRGKHKTSYTPHVDCGDNVVIINADKVRFTGNKLNDKVYTRHTGYPGGQRFATPKDLLNSKPERVLELAIGLCCQRQFLVTVCVVTFSSMRELNTSKKLRIQRKSILKPLRKEHNGSYQYTRTS